MPQCQISVCGCLVQDLCLRISASGSCRTSCARFCARISCSGSLCLQLDPVQPLEQDPCADPGGPLLRISCARSLSGSLRQDAVGPLVQVLCMSISSLSGSLHQDPAGPLVQELCMRISCARSLSEDLCVRIL